MKRTVCFLLVILLAAMPLLVGSAAEEKAYVLLEATTGTVIESSNEEEQLPVAGLVKLMSCLVIYDALESGAISAGDSVTISEGAHSKGGVRVFLDAGATYTVEELLKPAAMCGANDAITALAEHIAGSEAGFVERMNQRAAELGLGCTFVDCTGLSEGNRMSAYDCAIIGAALSQHSSYFKYSGIWMDTFTHESGRETELANANKLVKTEGFDGMITGSTSASGYSLVSSYKTGGARYICVVIGDNNTDDRFTLAREKTLAAAGQYAVRQIAQKGAKVTTVELKGAPDGELELYAGEDFALLLEKTAESTMKKEVQVDEGLTLPLAAGDVAGKLVVTLGDGRQESVDLVVREDVEERSFQRSLLQILSLWLHGGAA